MNQTFIVQRTDFITRSYFPELVTTIYKISNSNHLIYIHNTDNPLLEENNIIHKLDRFYKDRGNKLNISEFEHRILERFQYTYRNHNNLHNTILEKIQLLSFDTITDQELTLLINDQTFASHVSNYFDNHIRPVTVNVRITQNKPDDYLEIIQPIADKDIVSGFKGFSFTIPNLINLLSSKFPNLIIGKFENIDQNRDINIEVDRTSYDNSKKEIEEFLNGIDSSINFVIQASKTSITKKIITFKTNEYSNRTNPTLDFISPFLTNSTEFEQQDEITFFNHLDDIYLGKYCKDRLPFYNNNDIACFLDYSMIKDNPINIRNYLLWYDKIYMTIPVDHIWQQFYKNEKSYKSALDAFRNEHKIYYDEIIGLIKQDRINIILTQPIEHYNIGFINEIYKVNPSAIISRRAVNILLLMDIVEIFNNYPLKDERHLQEVNKLAISMSTPLGFSQQFMYDYLSWPIKAYRQSLDLLTFNTSHRFCNIGVNKIIQRHASSIYKKDLTFEYTSFATNVHIANALNATYFCSDTYGFNDDYYALTMGKILNSFKLFKYKDIELTQSIFPTGQSPIELFEVNNFSTVKDINNVYKTFSSAKHGQQLLRRLSTLENEDLSAEINYYNKAINEHDKDAKALKSAWDISYLWITATPLLPQSLILSILFGIGQMGIDALLDTNQVQKLLFDIYQNYQGNNLMAKNVHFLSKISPVAKFKQNY